MKKYIYDLSFKDMRTLISNNELLERQLFNDCMETANIWVSEYLEGCPASYQIGTYTQGEHFTLDADNLDKCKAWYKEVQGKFELINPKHDYIINLYFMTGNETLADTVNSIFYNRFLSEYECAFDIETLTDICITDLEKYFDSECYTDEYLTEVWQRVPEKIIPAHIETVY